MLLILCDDTCFLYGAGRCASIVEISKTSFGGNHNLGQKGKSVTNRSRIFYKFQR